MADEISQEQRAILERLLQASQAIRPPQDEFTGAPANVRAAVGSATTPEDRLATLRRFAPDAEPYQRDNFVFTSPRNGQRTLYNPRGLDWGDLASLAPEMGEGVGGVMGGFLGAPAGPLGVAAGVGLGAAAGRELMTLGGQAALGTVDTRGPGQRVMDAATTAGVNAVAGPAGDAVLRGARYVLGRRPGDAVNALRDYGALGITPGVEATGNQTTQMLARGLEVTPGGVGPIRDQARQQVDELGRAARETAERLGTPTNPMAAGGTIRQGAQAAAQRFRDRSGELYDDAFARVGADTPTALPSVQRLEAEIRGQLARAPESRARVLQPVLDEIERIRTDEAAGLSFDAMRAVRTDLGRRLHGGNPASAPSSDTAVYLDRLYGALTEDMGAVARQAGPDAAHALSLADRYTRINRNFNLPALETVLGKKTDEQIFGSLFPASGTPDAQAIARIRRNLTPDEWNSVAATVLDRMGMPRPGAGAGEDFSAATFLTHWNQLNRNGPAARHVLFGGSQNAELAANLDRLVRVTQRLREAERLANPSGTARNMVATGGALAAGSELMDGDMGGAAKVLGLTVLAPRLAARAITNPDFVRWLAGAAPQIAAHGAPSESAWRALTRIGVSNPGLRDVIEGYRDAFTRGLPATSP